MIRRLCSDCGKPAYSSDGFDDWECPYCGANIPKEGGELRMDTWEVKACECGHPWEVKACECGHPSCNKYRVNAIRNGLMDKEQAHLVAAAPEMCKALIQALGALKFDAMLDDNGKPFGTTTLAIKAIAKALAKAGGKE